MKELRHGHIDACEETVLVQLGEHSSVDSFFTCCEHAAAHAALVARLESEAFTDEDEDSYRAGWNDRARSLLRELQADPGRRRIASGTRSPHE